MNLILGVDPGLSGALALYDVAASSIHEIFDMPTIKAGTDSKRVVDETSLAIWVDSHAKNIRRAYVEKVGTRPGESPVAAFSFGCGYGVLRGVLAANMVPVTYVTPQAWKKALHVPAVKDGARARASQLLPRHSGLWLRVKDDGRAEAAMIALYGAGNG